MNAHESYSSVVPTKTNGRREEPRRRWQETFSTPLLQIAKSAPIFALWVHQKAVFAEPSWSPVCDRLWELFPESSSRRLQPPLLLSIFFRLPILDWQSSRLVVAHNNSNRSYQSSIDQHLFASLPKFYGNCSFSHQAN